MIEREVYQQDIQASHGNPKFKHKEHIIQNGIGGRLKSDDVLCEECGNVLNDEIDSNFIKLFSAFTERFKDKMAKERNRKATTSAKGYELSSKREIVLSDGVITPRTPVFDIIKEEKVVRIFASKGSMKSFKQHVLNSLKKEGIDTSEYSIQEITELANDENIGLFFSEGVHDFNSKWKLGFIKIATEFAYYHGVARDELKRVLDTQNNRMIFTDNVFPFFPIGVLDMFLEMNRIFIERNFPTHSLILFSQLFDSGKTELICYVDLFSTFQYYIILNEDYRGPALFKTYSQKLEKEVVPNIDFRKIRLKHLSIVINELGIDMSKYSGASNEELYEFLEAELKKIQPEYVLNLEEELGVSLGRITTAFTLAQASSGVAPEGLKEVIESLKGLQKDQILILMNEMQAFFNQDDSIYYSCHH